MNEPTTVAVDTIKVAKQEVGKQATVKGIEKERERGKGSSEVLFWDTEKACQDQPIYCILLYHRANEKSKEREREGE